MKMRLFDQIVAIFFRNMPRVAKRLVAGHTATAEHDSIANLISGSVGGLDRDTALDEDARADALLRVLQNLDSGQIVRLVLGSVLFNCRKPSCGAFVCCDDRLCVVKFAFGILGELPCVSAVTVTKPRKSAAAIVQQIDAVAGDSCSALMIIGFTRGFGSVKMGCDV